jgi:hypothetical protein
MSRPIRGQGARDHLEFQIALERNNISPASLQEHLWYVWWVGIQWFWIRGMVFNITFNIISAISWNCFIGGGNWGIQRKPSTCRKSDKRYHIMFYWVHIAWAGFKLTALVVIVTDCIGSCIQWFWTSRNVKGLWCKDEQIHGHQTVFSQKSW